MGPFTEATYDQLARLIKIIDNPHAREGDNWISYDFFLGWANGDVPAPWLSTEYVINNWETKLTKMELWRNSNKRP
jgi:hypothetical protein